MPAERKADNMLINIVILQDEDRAITDVVGFSDYKKADSIARELSARYGRGRVQRTTLAVNELPAFWGLTDENAAQQAVAADPLPAVNDGNNSDGAGG